MDQHIRPTKRVLAAIIPEAKQALASLIKDGAATIVYVYEFDEAINLLLSTNYDLIVCGIHFDDSRSLELLQRVKQMDRNRNTPFVVLRTNRKPIGKALTNSIQLAVKELGGTDYFDLSNSVLVFDQMKPYVAQVIEALIESGSKISSSQR